jgi:hypothetical protein
MSDRALVEGIGSLQGLTSLHLDADPNLTAQGLSTFLHGPSMSSIVSLRFTRFRYLDDEGLEGIAERCNKLTYLNAVQVFVCGCEVSLLCVCGYRCEQLRELAISGICNEQLTDAGVRNVIIHRTELCVLSLVSLKHITGMCAVCEVPEPTLCFITLCCMIFLQQVHH